MSTSKEDQNASFTLEDILREFGAANEPVPQEKSDSAEASASALEAEIPSATSNAASSFVSDEPEAPATEVHDTPTQKEPVFSSTARPTQHQAAAMSAAEMGLIDDSVLDSIIAEFGAEKAKRYSQDERLEYLEKNLRNDARHAPSMDYFEQQFGGYTDSRPQAQSVAPQHSVTSLTDSVQIPEDNKTDAHTEPNLPEDTAPSVEGKPEKRRKKLRIPFPASATGTPAEMPEPVPDSLAHPVSEAAQTSLQRKRKKAAVPFPTAPVTHTAEEMDEEIFDDDAEEMQFPFARKIKVSPKPEPPLTAKEGCLRYGKALRQTGTRVKLAGILTCFSLFFSAYYSLDWNFIAPLSQIQPIAWCINVVLALSILACYEVYQIGLRALKNRQFDLNTLTALATLIALLDGILSAGQRVGYGATACILLFLAQWSLHLHHQGMFRTLRVLDKNEITSGIVRSEDVFQGKAALFIDTCTPESFMEHVQQPSLADQVLRIYAPLAALLTLILAIAAQVKHTASFFQCWTPMLLSAVPAAGLLCYSRSFAILARRLAKRGAAICGWYGICAIGNRTAVLLRDADLFPTNTCEPNGVKSYNGYTGNQVVGYAEAVLQKAGSGLAPVLSALLEQEGGRHMQADAIRLYENSGIGGKFGTNTVLVGALSFMRRMGVHMNAETKVKRATYVSVNGELAGLIAIRYTAAAQVRDAVGILTRSGRSKPVLATCNVSITPKFLAQKFHVAADRFIFPDLRHRAELASRSADPDSTLCAVLSNPQIAAFADTATGGRILQTVVKSGLLMAMISGLIGICVLGALSLTGAIAALSASYLVLFDLIWLVPVLLLTGWTRSY